MSLYLYLAFRYVEATWEGCWAVRSWLQLPPSPFLSILLTTILNWASFYEVVLQKPSPNKDSNPYQVLLALCLIGGKVLVISPADLEKYLKEIADTLSISPITWELEQEIPRRMDKNPLRVWNIGGNRMRRYLLRFNNRKAIIWGLLFFTLIKEMGGILNVVWRRIDEYIWHNLLLLVLPQSWGYDRLEYSIFLKHLKQLVWWMN